MSNGEGWYFIQMKSDSKRKLYSLPYNGKTPEKSHPKNHMYQADNIHYISNFD